MNCERHQQRISRVLDDALAEGTMADVFSHLGMCDECRAFFRATMQLRRALRNAAPMNVPAAVDSGVIGFAAVSSMSFPSGTMPPIRPVGRSPQASIRTIALALLVLVIGCVMFSTTLSIDTRGMSTTTGSSQSMQLNGAR